MADTVHESALRDSPVWFRCEEGVGKDAGRAVMDSIKQQGRRLSPASLLTAALQCQLPVGHFHLSMPQQLELRLLKVHPHLPSQINASFSFPTLSTIPHTTHYHDLSDLPNASHNHLLY